VQAAINASTSYRGNAVTVWDEMIIVTKYEQLCTSTFSTNYFVVACIRTKFSSSTKFSTFESIGMHVKLIELESLTKFSTRVPWRTIQGGRYTWLWYNNKNIAFLYECATQF
jgi:hypothetical protein